VLEQIRKTGKNIPLSSLSRNRNWRIKIVDSHEADMEEFAGSSVVQLECPICSLSSVEKGEVRGVPYRACASCDHLFSGLMPSEEFLGWYYGHSDSAQIEAYVNVLPNEAQNRQSEIGSQKVKFVNEAVLEGGDDLTSGSGLWVDIGCGVGDILVSAGQAGYETLGIETDGTQASVARSRGIRVIEEFLGEQSRIPEELSEASVVSLFNILEHVVSPESFLRHLCATLERGAVVVIEVPRYPSLSAIFQLAGIHRIHRYICPPEHLNIFSDRSMQLLFEKVGLGMTGVWKYGSDALEAFTSVGDNLGWAEGFDSSELPEAMSKLQASVDRADLSDTMIVIGKKV
jgi:SAM-dependent methyltransferase